MKITLINTEKKQIVDVDADPHESLQDLARKSGFPLQAHWFVEEIQDKDYSEDSCDVIRPIHEHGHERPIFRCHSCRHIEVTVSFNGEVKSHAFAPRARVKRVVRKFVTEFAVDKGLPWVLSKDETKAGILAENHVIGEYVPADTCSVKLYLIDKDKVNG